jgi:hypothetical protein
MDEYDNKEGTEELILDYVFDVINGDFKDNFLSYHPKFQSYISNFYDKKTSRKTCLENFFGRDFPLNTCGFHTDTFN